MLILKEEFFKNLPQLKNAEHYFKNCEVLRYDVNLVHTDYVMLESQHKITYDYYLESRNVKLIFSINDQGTFWKIIRVNYSNRRFEI
jgi:hypothetical protein